MNVQSIPDLEHCCHVVLGGEIGHANAHKFFKGLESVIKKGFWGVILDLRDVSYMNSSALAGLIKLEDQLQDGFLALVGLQPKARIVMDNLGITGIFRIFDTPEEALIVAREKLGASTSQPEQRAPAQTPAAPAGKAAEPAESPVRPTEKTPVPPAIPAPGPDVQHMFHPSISITGLIRRRNQIYITLDLHRERPVSDDITDGVRLNDLPSDWDQVPVIVEMQAKGVSFRNFSDKGAILVRRHDSAVSCTLVGTVSRKPPPDNKLRFTASFRYGDRSCGSVYCEVALPEP